MQESDQSTGRKQRERDFHNERFTASRLRQADSFYAAARGSLGFYKRLLAAWCKNKLALNYGCGPGGGAFVLARSGARAIGVDLSDAAIKKAAQTAQREHLSASFAVMDAEVLAFGDHTFDFICGTGILHHLRLRRAFSEVARTLRPDGRAVFMEPLGHNPLVNLYRRLTPQSRTRDEHPLVMKDLDLAREYFGQVETYFFHLVSLVTIPLTTMRLGSLRWFERLLQAVDQTDQALFRLVPAARRYAWVVVIVLADPLVPRCVGRPNRGGASPDSGRRSDARAAAAPRAAGGSHP